MTLPTIQKTVQDVTSGKLSAEELVEAALERCAKAASLNAIVHLGADSARAAARALDLRRARGEALGPLAGVPLAVKDALTTVDLPTTCGSRILSGRTPWQPPYDSTVVQRLRAAGAIVIGKANMDEFAMGSSTETSAYGPTLNPWDQTRIPGGSSGGSAVAVAARLTAGSIGSDTGGSIRQPAGLCGVVGVKPSYGRVSRYGLVAYASSLDQIGPFAADTRGAARLLSVIAGHDPLDSTSHPSEVPDFEAACERPLPGLRLGVPEEYFGAGLDPEIAEAVKEAIESLARAGCQVGPVSLPHTRYGVATYYILATAEASSNLARFDGVRFGLREEPSGGDLCAMYGATREAGFGAEVKRRILLGTYVLSAGYYDAYYRKAQRVRTLIRRDFAAAFSKVDAIITPISPTPAFRLGEKTEDPLAMYLGDIYTLPCNLAGICGASVPVRGTRATSVRPSLPVGMQILAPPFREDLLFAVAAGWERIHGPFPAPPSITAPSSSS